MRVTEIPPEGISRVLDFSETFLQESLADTEADSAASKAGVRLDLNRSGREVVVRGAIDGKLAVLCSRCAGPAKVTVREPIEVVYVPRGAETDRPEPEDPADEVDLIPYDGDDLDLSEMLREELLLSLPLAPLCKESCRGLCPRCGADLNDGACGCPAETSEDPRFAALRNLKVSD